MNTIASFRKCTLSDVELIKEVDRQTDEMFKNQSVPTRHIPARPNSDYDLLVGELILRFHKLANLQNTIYHDDGTVTLPSNYEGVDG